MTCIDHRISECLQKACAYWWYVADVDQVIGALSSCLMELQEDAWEAVSELAISASTPIAP